MGYRSLRECVADLERHGQLRRVEAEVDPHLEMAEIHRRVYQSGGPALLFPRVKGCSFPMVSNLFGTIERTRFLFRDTLEAVRKVVELKVDPGIMGRKPWRYLGLPFTLLHALPRRIRSGPILQHQTRISQLPKLVCWPRDGGPFVTLPQVYSEDPNRPGWRHSNLGMYRVQLSGNEYETDREVGLHYQIHRGIGVHHAAAIRQGKPFPVNIWVGGPPALAVSAVMPLPEGLPEVAFAGMLGGRRLRLVPSPNGLLMPAEADFCFVGVVDSDRQKVEGPFGDHLGYYSLTHDFPVLKVQAVYHREGAIWPFTVVGRPPQEDTSFGEFIHELTGPVIPTVIAGVKAVHAVDASGVHPLLLAIGSERYVPYAPDRRPQEILTQANAILGQGQLSLAKYLMIIAHEDAPNLEIDDIEAFFTHLLERFDPQRDLHFQTRTTIDTLDYSGSGLNEGSKLVIAAAGHKRRNLARNVPSSLRLPEAFGEPRMCHPGVMAIRSPQSAAQRDGTTPAEIQRFLLETGPVEDLQDVPVILLVDDSEFAARSLNNWIWLTFTRSNPASDVHGFGSFVHHKHWGCTGPLVIDARFKTYMAPPLVEDPAVTRRVDSLACRGGPLEGLF